MLWHCPTTLRSRGRRWQGISVLPDPSLLIFVKPGVCNSLVGLVLEMVLARLVEAVSTPLWWCTGCCASGLDCGECWGELESSSVDVLPQSITSGDVPAFGKRTMGPELPLRACSMLKTNRDPGW